MRGCHDFGYVRLGNVEHVRFGNVELGDVALGNVELFGLLVCGMSVVELLLTLEGLRSCEKGYVT